MFMRFVSGSDDLVFQLCHFQAEPRKDHLVDAVVAYLVNPYRVRGDIEVVPAIIADFADSHFVDIAFEDRFLGVQTEFLQKVMQGGQPLWFCDIVGYQDYHFSNTGLYISVSPSMTRRQWFAWKKRASPYVSCLSAGG